MPGTSETDIGFAVPKFVPAPEVTIRVAVAFVGGFVFGGAAMGLAIYWPLISQTLFPGATL